MGTKCRASNRTLSISSLLAFDYIHSEYKAVRTGECLMSLSCTYLEFQDLIYLSDLKQGNSLMKFENENILVERSNESRFPILVFSRRQRRYLVLVLMTLYVNLFTIPDLDNT
jgi:hypothetical protein